MRTTRAANHEVIIAGGGYAGLAAALALGERALIVEQHEIGAIQRSACAMPFPLAERLGVRDAVLQVYPDGFVHTTHGTSRYQLQPPYCIFDHTRLCQSLFERSGARHLRARVQGLDGDAVLTSAGPVHGQVLIDASGWPAVLATARRPELADPRLTVGIEAEIPGRDDGIHFYFDPAIVRRGYAWVFPAGGTLRIGVGAYDGQPKLAAALGRFLQQLGHTGKPARGGRIPWFARPATIDNIFLAGDAAGHCLPLTAEGIRFAFFFGALAGQLVGDVLDGRRDLTEARALYEQRVRRHQRRMAALRMIQGLVGPFQNRGIHLVGRLLALPPVAPRVTRRYARWSE